MILRIYLITILLLVLVQTGQSAHAIDLELTGTWTITIDSGDLAAGPGTDLTAIYESPADQVLVDILNSMGGGDSWRIDVKKSDVSWNSNLSVYARRTSDGFGGSVSGGESYQIITNSDQSLFTGTDDITDIGMQYKINGVSININPNNYATTIIYTVVDT
jgi:hypothetical protein